MCVHAGTNIHDTYNKDWKYYEYFWAKHSLDKSKVSAVVNTLG